MLKFKAAQMSKPGENEAGDGRTEDDELASESRLRALHGSLQVVLKADISLFPKLSVKQVRRLIILPACSPARTLRASS